MTRAWKFENYKLARGVLTTAGVSVAAVSSAVAAVSATAAPPAWLAPPAPAVTLAGSVTQQQVIEAVEKRYKAKVVRVTETTVNGKPALELRLLSDQRVWNVVVDAISGQELSRG